MPGVSPVAGDSGEAPLARLIRIAESAMFGLGRATSPRRVGMRIGFDGLFGLVADRLARDPLRRHSFRFANRGRTRLKVRVLNGSRLVAVREAVGEGTFPIAGRKVGTPL